MKNLTFLGAKFFLGPKGGPDLKKSENPYTGGLKPQPKFQHSCSIKKCLKIEGFLGVFRPPREGGGPNIKKLKKTPYRTVVLTYSQNFSTRTQLESV